jgi:hypothetical protein
MSGQNRSGWEEQFTVFKTKKPGILSEKTPLELYMQSSNIYRSMVVRFRIPSLRK